MQILITNTDREVFWKAIAVLASGLPLPELPPRQSLGLPGPGDPVCPGCYMLPSFCGHPQPAKEGEAA